tara:strand:- start:1472 stop:1717 length:246 start_codon:yes stop_codon:yes gene_type:complete
MDTTIVVAAGSALGAAIAYMFGLLMKVVERVGRLEGEHEGIVNLSKKTLETVELAISQRDDDDKQWEIVERAVNRRDEDKP